MPTPPAAAKAPAAHAARPAPGLDLERAALARRYQAVRERSLALVAPLSPEDCQAQSMPDASPAKWHLAHVTWFFETFVLERFEPCFQPFHPAFRALYNSYYNGVGEPFSRPQRGPLTRPDFAEVLRWRAEVDQRVARLLRHTSQPEALALIELGVQHEQQHQELLLTDIKHLLSINPLHPVYRRAWPLSSVASVPAQWVERPGGLVEIGHAGPGFAFDNESPRHPQWLQPHALMNRPVTHGEWLAFVRDGGYTDPRWWLAAGWDWLRAEGLAAPLYWTLPADSAALPTVFTLHGDMPLDPHTPVTHISYYEADAFARWASASRAEWAGARLPSEAEWEASAAALPVQGNCQDSGALHPMPARAAAAPGALLQIYGDVWEWTNSSYSAYPGYQPAGGAVGEYNGKFMVNQLVLRGGSCATPLSHLRASYRNFFPASARWQFSGLRLARSL
ncbi:ergothioneine biosynthesis protein EgtB [Hydrogenophaga taeniospiralis]|uniref:ergothioneine biosynthesis protein EgtB n=1 Tax=Hydrogenophaga taeniospiralis TaxID=65656 RepID=UPI001CFA104C|nr:ergothioneine biosynthesis protein EgtB [Hydrogenophaga taeniospiralis]MCB4366622.1 ergothioneine biosynthesis protein EgtB [Hydrogenophaga taeniospiralis]